MDLTAIVGISIICGTLIALKDEANKHFSDFEKVIQTYE